MSVLSIRMSLIQNIPCKSVLNNISRIATRVENCTTLWNRFGGMMDSCPTLLEEKQGKAVAHNYHV